MRYVRFVYFLGLAIVSLAPLPHSTHAATIEGRVVDSDGKPVAGAEVQVWQKIAGPDRRLTDQLVEFDGGDMLLTDAEGRFVSPNVLVAAPTQVVAEAPRMLAGRSGLIRVGKDAVTVKLLGRVLLAR